jgi:Transposase DDE domain
MRSRKGYIIIKEEVHGYANQWLNSALRLEYEGTKCTGFTIMQVLLIAAARVVSLFAACSDLADAPSSKTLFNALGGALPDIDELQRRLNLSLVTEIPKALRRKRRILAIDLTLIPYHGEPALREEEVYRGQPKSGTTHFHAYATAVVVHKGHRYTLALMRVERGVAMKDVVQTLLTIVRRRGVRIKYVLLDKGFYSVAVISYLKRARYGFIIPAVPRGRKRKAFQPARGLRALLKKRHGFYSHTLTCQKKGERGTTRVSICVASKSYTHTKSGKRNTKKLLYAVHKVRGTPYEIRENYRKRFGIETTYRQLNEARIKTTTRDPALRLLFVGIALVLRNVWVWLHFQLAKGKWSDEPELFLQLLRFSEFLLWITQIVQRLLGADKTEGIEYETYERLAAGN